MATQKRNGRPPLPGEVWDVFLQSYEESGCVRTAAHLAGAGVRTVYRWMADDEEKRAGFDAVREAHVGDLEASLFQRALNGDATCLIFALKSWRPSVYNRAPQPTPRPEAEERGEIRVEIIAPDGGRQALMDKLSQQSRRMEGTGAEAGY